MLMLDLIRHEQPEQSIEEQCEDDGCLIVAANYQVTCIYS